MPVPDRLREYRRQRELSVTDLAMLMHVSREMIEKIETGDLLPDVDFLTRLSGLLDVPLSELLPEDSPLPLPFDYGKPKSLKPIAAILALPTLLVLGALFSPSFGEAWPLLLVAVVFPPLADAMGFFDFRRFYTYFSVTKEGILIFEENRLPKIANVVLAAFKRRKTRNIRFADIKVAKISFNTSGSKGMGTIVAYRPRQSYRVREPFLLELTLEDKTEVDLDLSQAFYPESKEREYFDSLFRYLCSQGIAVEDPSKVIYSFQHGLNFIDEAYARDENEEHKKNTFY